MKQVFLQWPLLTKPQAKGCLPTIEKLPKAALDGKENALCIPLPADTKASLDWQKEIELAKEAILQGLDVVWDIQLGLFHNLLQPLSSKSQLFSLQLALDQFREKIWSQFSKNTCGVFFYRGSLEFASALPWEEEQTCNFYEWQEKYYFKVVTKELSGPLADSFACHVAMEYLHLLAPHLPQEALIYLLFDVSKHQTLIDEAYLLNRERFVPFTPIALHSKHSLQSDKAPLGICLPPLAQCLPERYDILDIAFDKLIKNQIPYRLVPEEQLTARWDGLDEIIVVKESVSLQTKRKLQGFNAAGGKVLTLGSSLIGLPYEELFTL